MAQESSHIPWIPSASSAGQTLACPGWPALTYYYRKQLKPEDDTYSKPGEMAHLLIESEFRSLPKKEVKAARRFLKETDKQEQHFAAIRFAVKTIKKVIKKQADAKYAAERAVVIFNDVLNIKGNDKHNGFTGTVDLTILTETKIIVIDYKHGVGVPVKAENNKQGLSYLYGVYKNLKPEMQKRIKTFEFRIIQPRCSGVDPVQVFKIKKKKLLHEVKIIRAGVLNAAAVLQMTMDTQTKPPKMHLFRGDQCQFCPAKVQCPRWREPVGKVVKQFRTDKDLSDDAYPDMSIEDLEQLLLDAEGIAKYINDGKDIARSQITKGKGAGLLKLGEGQQREYPKANAVERLKDLYANNSLSKADLKQCITEQVATLAVLKRHLGTNQYRSIVDKRQNKPSLIRATAKTKTKAQRAKDVFKS